jgi:hypothetical protein
MTRAEKISEKINMGDGTILVVMGIDNVPPGIDLGERHCMVVYDLDPEVAKSDQAKKLLEHPRVKVVVGEESVEAAGYSFLVFFGGRFQIIVDKTQTKYCQKVDALLTYLKSVGINISTLNHFGQLFAGNIIQNVPEILRSFPVSSMHNCFSGVPATLVAAGPSLDQHKGLLHEVTRKTVTIFPDTLIGLSRELQVLPDFFVCVDPQEETFNKVKNGTPYVPLFFHPACYYQVPRVWKGLLVSTDTYMAPYRMMHIPEAGHIEEETQCQMHLAFNLARWMGCNPIILLGQDLCYKSRQLHVKGGEYTYSEEDIDRTLDTTNIPETDIFGDPVVTNDVFLSYRNTYQRKIASYKGKVVNATEGGLNIEGAENRKLRDVLDRLKEVAYTVSYQIDNRDEQTDKVSKRIQFIIDSCMVSMSLAPNNDKLHHLLKCLLNTRERLNGK